MNYLGNACSQNGVPTCSKARGRDTSSWNCDQEDGGEGGRKEGRSLEMSNSKMAKGSNCLLFSQHIFGYEGTQPSINHRGNPPPNGMYTPQNTYSYIPSHTNPYVLPSNNAPYNHPSIYQQPPIGGTLRLEDILCTHPILVTP